MFTADPNGCHFKNAGFASSTMLPNISFRARHSPMWRLRVAKSCYMEQIARRRQYCGELHCSRLAHISAAGRGRLVANTLDLMSGMLKRPGKFSRNLLLDLAPLVCSNAIQACTGNYPVFSFPLLRSNYIQTNGAPFLVRLRGPLAFYCRKAVLT
jgi:hypothetical protein